MLLAQHSVSHELSAGVFLLILWFVFYCVMFIWCLGPHHYSRRLLPPSYVLEFTCLGRGRCLPTPVLLSPSPACSTEATGGGEEIQHDFPIWPCVYLESQVRNSHSHPCSLCWTQISHLLSLYLRYERQYPEEHDEFFLPAFARNRKTPPLWNAVCLVPECVASADLLYFSKSQNLRSLPGCQVFQEVVSCTPEVPCLLTELRNYFFGFSGATSACRLAQACYPLNPRKAYY